jgi:hypothetical protein
VGEVLPRTDGVEVVGSEDAFGIGEGLLEERYGVGLSAG